MQSVARQTAIVLATGLMMVLGPAPDAVLSAEQSCTSLSGTIYGHHEPGAWVGKALLSLGGAEAERASFVTTSGGLDFPRFLAGKPTRGKEKTTFTFDDGSTFAIDATFVLVFGPTPGLGELNETGEITDGNGRFSGASGHVSVHGPFVSPLVEDRPPWIAELHGSVCGMQP